MITLNESQKETVSKLISAVKNNQPYAVVKGYAGVGKTTLIQEFIRALLDDGYAGAEITLTAPTNKAVRVLRDKALQAGIKVDSRTIHSLLRIIAQEVEETDPVTGALTVKQVFKPVTWENAGEESPIERVKVLVIDECSMISTELLKYIDESQAEYGFTVVFTGDPAQLPPVGEGEKESISFQMAPDYTSILTEVVRQAADNPIIQTLTSIRNKLDAPVYIASKTIQAEGDTHGIEVFDYPDKFSAKLLQEFENFEQDPNHVRLIAWTNRTVGSYNKTIREVKFGERAKEAYLDGEILIMKKPFYEKDKYGNKVVVADNSEEFVIESKSEALLEVEEFNFRATVLVVKSLNDNRVKRLKICHPSDEERYKKLLRDLPKEAKSSPDKGIAKAIWRKFFSLKECFAEMDYAYALTAHNSQGSTFNKVMVVARDINRNPNVVERNQCLYVALSRCRFYAGVL